MLDASAGGALVDKTPMAAMTLIANRALNAQQYEGVGQRGTSRQHQVNEVSAITELQNQMANLTTLLSQVVEVPRVQNVSACGVCSMQGHPTDKCPQLIENGGWETLNAVGFGQQYQQRNDPFSNTYNPVGVIIQISNGENPNKANNKARGFETAKAITLRSGKQVGTEPQASHASHEDDEKLQFEENTQAKPTAKREPLLPQPSCTSHPYNSAKVSSILTSPSSSPLNVPFPSRLRQSKKEETEKDILETFRKVQVNIPLLDAIKQVPRYAKFLKELCTTRKRISNKEVVQVSENVSAVLQRKLPPKCKDPGELKNDGVIIQLADRSNAYPKGVLEDVLVQVDNLIFPADFYVLEMEDSPNVTPLPILLGRPFMKAARTKIDVFKWTLTMEFDGEIINFNISEAMKFPKDDHSCFSIDILDEFAQDYLDMLEDDPLETTIAQGLGTKPNLAVTMEEHAEIVASLESLPQHRGKASN
ncbi:unnamed protein product [Malus baccata var. baccata]